MSHPFVIFDRDGTLIKHIHYLSDPDGVELSPNLIPGLKLLRSVGFKFGIVSNQSIINRGIASVEQVEAVNSRVIQILNLEGFDFEFVYYCPHTAEQNCYCRKPEPGLGITAIREYKIDQKSSFMVGDQPSDVIFGHAIGLRAIQVGRGMNSSHLADFSTEDVLSAAQWIISRLDG